MPCYLGKRLSLPTFLPHLVLPFTGRFFVNPPGKALPRVGAGVAWMPGGGLYGRPLLEEARPVPSSTPGTHKEQYISNKRPSRFVILSFLSLATSDASSLR